MLQIASITDPLNLHPPIPHTEVAKVQPRSQNVSLVRFIERLCDLLECMQNLPFHCKGELEMRL